VAGSTSSKVRRIVRRALSRLDRSLPRLIRDQRVSTEREREIESFLRSLDLPEDPRAYLEHNMHRIVTTLTLVPGAGTSGRALELGAYMQMTPALACLLGYTDVVGAYYGPLGRTDVKISTVDGKEIFRCPIDLFDAERDRFPYEDGLFETVLACEILEHLLHDPMHMLVEIHRVLDEGGTMILSTPNATSYSAIVHVLRQDGNPQLYSQYPDPTGEGRETEVPHVREYAPGELREAVEAAGFEVEALLTEPLRTFDPTPVQGLLEREGFPTELRGELMFCVARKRSGRRVIRYPGFLYDGASSTP
jgi:SAM-dependent methyltransferase